MPVISQDLVQANLSIDQQEVKRRLLAGETLLSDTPDHLLEVVGVLESYGEVLDAYSINLIYQAEEQFLIRSRSSNISTAIGAPPRSGAT